MPFADFFNRKRYYSWSMKYTVFTTFFKLKVHNSRHEIMQTKSLHSSQLTKTYSCEHERECLQSFLDLETKEIER